MWSLQCAQIAMRTANSFERVLEKVCYSTSKVVMMVSNLSSSLSRTDSSVALLETASKHARVFLHSFRLCDMYHCAINSFNPPAARIWSLGWWLVVRRRVEIDAVTERKVKMVDESLEKLTPNQIFSIRPSTQPPNMTHSNDSCPFYILQHNNHTGTRHDLFRI